MEHWCVGGAEAGKSWGGGREHLASSRIRRSWTDPGDQFKYLSCGRYGSEHKTRSEIKPTGSFLLITKLVSVHQMEVARTWVKFLLGCEWLWMALV